MEIGKPSDMCASRNIKYSLARTCEMITYSAGRYAYHNSTQQIGNTLLEIVAGMPEVAIVSSLVVTCASLAAKNKTTHGFYKNY